MKMQRLRMMKLCTPSSPLLRRVAVFGSVRSPGAGNIALQLKGVRMMASSGGEVPGEGWLWQSISASKTRQKLESEGLRAKKSLGQNFLVDDEVLEKIVQTANIKEGDAVIEVGPGTGNLTRQLLRAGARVLAIEKDTALAAKLNDSLLTGTEEQRARFRLVTEDVLKCDLAALADELTNGSADRGPGEPSTSSSSAAPRRRIKLVTNLPYNITTEFLKQALPLGDTFSDLYVMLQDEAGARFARAEVGSEEYRAMTVRARFFSDISYLFTIPASAYFPQPRVTSCMVRFELRRPRDYPKIDNGTPQDFIALVGLAFESRRKMLKNNCARLYGEEEMERALRDLGMDPRIRAERLSTDDFVRLLNRLGSQGKKGALNPAAKPLKAWKQKMLDEKAAAAEAGTPSTTRAEPGPRATGPGLSPQDPATGVGSRTPSRESPGSASSRTRTR